MLTKEEVIQNLEEMITDSKCNWPVTLKMILEWVKDQTEPECEHVLDAIVPSIHNGNAAARCTKCSNYF